MGTYLLSLEEDHVGLLEENNQQITCINVLSSMVPGLGTSFRTANRRLQSSRIWIKYIAVSQRWISSRWAPMMVLNLDSCLLSLETPMDSTRSMPGPALHP